MRTGLLIGLMVFPFFASAQVRVNTDSLFSVAINQAAEKKYDQALTSAFTAYRSDTLRGDILGSIANLYWWSGRNDSALYYINKAMLNRYINTESYESWTNILFSLHKYEALLTVCASDSAIKYLSTSSLLRKRLLVYLDTENYVEAERLHRDTAYAEEFQIVGLKDLYQTILQQKYKQQILAYYSIDAFDNADPQQLLSLGYYYRMSAHTVGVKLNGAQRLGRKGFQLEFEDYIPFRNKSYLYFDYGNNFYTGLFPLHRAGLSYYMTLTTSTQLSLGGRYLYYPDALRPSVFTLVGSLDKSYARSSVSFRTYFTPNLSQRSLVYSLQYKRWGRQERNFWALAYGFGNSPDDYYSTQSSGGLNELSSYSIRLSKNTPITSLSEINIQLGYAKEQYSILQPDVYRSRFIVELSYKTKL